MFSQVCACSEGRGYLPWTGGVTTLDGGIPTLNGGYLPCTGGSPSQDGGTLGWMGVPLVRLDRVPSPLTETE